ncbi:carboxylate--amine ligase [Actinopolyspora erythraea]|uniref:Carboxylate--amine ligase n=1 Tax=Actinopolyspora erythraea TaxID=414996 RepID=A0A099D5W6_9ACTN|nr:ATP-grasp domain-containing protein [Actinopolyspora erythraea]ASU78654.1 carboxylate--amine ligase [Actinopolyspora erythraea]KGI81414.1 carboxylate--amine ligase [Actinopolyspora erythraea]
MIAPNPPTMLFVGGAGNSRLAVDVAEQALGQARRRGLRTHVINQEDTLAATPSVSAAADVVSAVDFTRPGESSRWARERVAAGERFDVVFGVRDIAQEAVAEVSDILGVAGNPTSAVRRVRTKDTCRAALREAGFPQPSWRVCTDAAEARDFLDSSTGPWVIKPRDATGSQGVSRVTGHADLHTALEFLPAGSSFLVEEFVEGAEFSVEGVFLGGVPTVLAVTAKEKISLPYFSEVGHVIPAQLPEFARREMERQVTSALLALGLRYGQFHVELWWTSNGVVLGEFHVRNAGGWIHRMLAHAIPGLEWFGHVYDDARGVPAGGPELTPTRGAAVRFFTPPPGRLISISGWEEVLAHPAVLDAELTVVPGDVLGAPRSFEDRVGQLVVGAETSGQARKIARGLAESVHFEVQPEETPLPADR